MGWKNLRGNFFSSPVQLGTKQTFIRPPIRRSHRSSLTLWLTVLICSFLYTYCGATPTVCDGDENADPEFDCMAFPPDNLNSEVGDNVGDYTISWGEVAGAEKYEFVEHCSRSVIPEAEIPWASAKVEVMPKGSTRKSIINKETGLYCRYRTRSCNAHGCGRYSKIFSFVVGAYPPSNVVVSFPSNIGDADYSGAYQLTWDEPSQGGDAITGYEWRESSDGGDTWGNGRFVAANASRELDFSTQEFGKTYSYQLRSCHPSPFPGEPKVCGPWSAPEEIPVDVPTPSGIDTPDSPSYTGAYSVSWNALGSGMRDIVYYQLSENDNTDGLIRIDDGTSDSHSISNQPFQADYRYKIRACVNPSSNRGQACSPWSSASTPIAVRLQVPSGLAMSDANGVGNSGSTTTSYDGDYQLSWDNNVTGATRYELGERTVDTQPWSSVSSCTNTPCIITGKSAGSATYKYAVRACLGTSGNEANCGDWTASGNVVSVSVPVLGAPSLNSDVTGGTSNSGNYNISRGNVTGAVSYQLQTRSKAKSATWSTWAPTDTTDITSFSSSPQSFLDQDYGRDYQYRVHSCAGSNCSPWSTPTEVAVRLDALTSITMSDTLGVNDADVPGVSYDGTYTLSWSANITGADRYELQESSNGGSDWLNVTGVSCDPTTCSVDFTNQASSSTGYSYQVRACSAPERGNACGSWFSLNVSVPSLSAPESVAIYDTDGNSISTSYGPSYDVKWTAVSNAVSYEIQQEVDGDGIWDNFASIAIEDDATTGYKRVTPVVADYQKSYSYQVRACNGNNCSNWSTATSVTVNLAKPGSLSFSSTSIITSSNYTVSWNHPASVGSDPHQIPISTISYYLEESSYSDFSTDVSTILDVSASPDCEATSGNAGYQCSFSPSSRSGKTLYYRVKLLLRDGGDESAWRTSSSGVAISWWPSLNLALNEESDIDGSYTLSWTNPGSDYSLNVEQKTDSFRYNASGASITNTGTWSGLSGIVTANASHLLSSQIGQATYTYRGRLCRSDDSSVCNSQWSEDSVDVLLPTPTNLRIPSPNNFTYGGDYTVEWDDGGDYSLQTRTYAIKRNLRGSLSSVSESSLSYDPPAHYTSGTYTYSIAACTSIGCTHYTASASLVIENLSSPSLSTSDGNLQYYNGQYQLGWTAPFAGAYTGTRRYQLQDGSGDDIILSSLGALNHSFGSPSSPLGGGSYSYKVRACASSDTSKCSPWSNTLYINVPNLNLSGLSLSSNDGHVSGDGAYTMSWNAISGATSYALLENSIEISCTGTRSCLLNGKSDGNSFDYQVKACADTRCVTSSTYTVAVDLVTEISTCAQLNSIRSNLSRKYKLVSNIDASCITNPIGTQSSPFTGNFNGAGYTISNLTINSSSNSYIGLFGKTSSSAKIQNVGLVDVNISGYEYVGSLIGYNNGSIANSYVTGSVTGEYHKVGGLAGYNDGSIANSYATATVSSQGSSGGLVGVNEAGSIANSYATGSVTSSDASGGLVGGNTGSITNSYAAGTVSGIVNKAGGLAGWSNVGASISGINYFVDSDGGNDGVGEGSCSGCTQRTIVQLTQLDSVSGWADTNWSFGESPQLPTLKYAQVAMHCTDPSYITKETCEAASVPASPKYWLGEGDECGGRTGIDCGVQIGSYVRGGNWYTSSWSSWSNCSQTCGGGTQSKSRTVTCNYDVCEGNRPSSSDSQSCNTQSCCTDRSWSPSTYTTCATATLIQTQACTGLTQTVSGTKTSGGSWSPPRSGTCATYSLTQTNSCSGLTQIVSGTKSCPWSADSWSPWSTCSRTCGGGTQTRSRSVTCGYDSCTGSRPSTSDSQICNTQSCCTDRSWSPDPSTVCTGQTFTQTQACTGATRPESGTKQGTWSSLPLCWGSSETVVQTHSCTGAIRTRRCMCWCYNYCEWD